MLAVKVACFAVACFTMVVGVLMFAAKMQIEGTLVVLIAFCLAYLSDELGSKE